MDEASPSLGPGTTVHLLRFPSICRRTLLGWGGSLQVATVLVLVTSVAATYNISKTLSPSILTPPQLPLAWDHSATDILDLTIQAITQNREHLDTVGALAPRNCNFTSVFLPLAYAEARFKTATQPLSFYLNVSPSKELRDASTEAQALINNYNVDASMRLDVHQAKIHAQNNIHASGWDNLSAEDRRLIEKLMLTDKRAGLSLPEKERVEITALRKELSHVCLEFNNNANAENGFISFSAKELKGITKDDLTRYKTRKKGSRRMYEVPFKGPAITNILGFAENPETRKRVLEAQEESLAVNVPLLERALELRRRLAELLGYHTWADYVTEVNMIKNASGVHDFLDDLETKLRPLGLQELENLLALKKVELEDKGLPYDGEFYAWDYEYYFRKYTQKTLGLEGHPVKEYFPVSAVVPAILGIYQDLLGVRFEEIKTSSTWHPDVQLFAVWKKEAKDASGFLGYCYLDLFPRASKYSHAAAWSLLPGYDNLDGTRSYPVTAMVANLANPRLGKVALMSHRSVVTFFHEMGHVFHNLLSRTKHSTFHGMNVAGDFKEAPSKMLENWCWDSEVLRKISSHYKTKEPLSTDLINGIIKSRRINSGLFYLKQLFYAKFDMAVHTDPGHVNSTELWSTLKEGVTLLKSDKAVPGQGAFLHIMSGYDAAVYGYLYSQVFAADMYETVFKGDPLDPARGAEYVEKILRPGSTRDELDSLEDFLGRPPNSEAFIASF